MAFVVERRRENFEEAPKQAGPDPVLKSPVAGLIRQIAVRPRRSFRCASVGKKGPMSAHCSSVRSRG
jgi:hypothetical protein